MELGSLTAADAGGCAGRGRQRRALAGRAEHRALSCWSTGAHLSVILVLAFDIALRQGGGVKWLL